MITPYNPQIEHCIRVSKNFQLVQPEKKLRCVTQQTRAQNRIENPEAAILGARKKSGEREGKQRKKGLQGKKVAGTGRRIMAKDSNEETSVVRQRATGWGCARLIFGSGSFFIIYSLLYTDQGAWTSIPSRVIRPREEEGVSVVQEK